MELPDVIRELADGVDRDLVAAAGGFRVIEHKRGSPSSHQPVRNALEEPLLSIADDPVLEQELQPSVNIFLEEGIGLADQTGGKRVISEEAQLVGEIRLQGKESRHRSSEAAEEIVDLHHRNGTDRAFRGAEHNGSGALLLRHALERVKVTTG